MPSKPSIPVTCRRCGSDFLATPWAVRRGTVAYCSRACRNAGRSLEERTRAFWANVRRGEPSACWPWQAGTAHKGYGHARWPNAEGRIQDTNAQRVAWLLTNGPIPEGVFVLHRCDNPPCCNPAHLFLGTNADNVQDMIAKGRGGLQARPERAARGERVSVSKLTEAQVLEIRALYAAGVRRGLARRFGVHRHSITNIVNGKTWRHV